MFIPPPLTVMQEIWSHSDGEFVYTPHMHPEAGWIEGEGFRPELTKALLFNGMGERYFTPLRYNGKRRRDEIGRPGVIFADLDGEHLPPPFEPSVVINSSPNHYHAYWFLTEPADLVDWEPRARGMSEYMDADPGGWDATQVLRVPGTLNRKRSLIHEVTTMVYSPQRVYELTDFPQTEIRLLGKIDRPAVNRAKRDSYLKRALAIDNVPLSAHYWLTVTHEELKALGTIDRSRILWQLERQLFEAGFTDQEVFQLVWFSAINKHTHPSQLWREVTKASAA